MSSWSFGAETEGFERGCFFQEAVEICKVVVWLRGVARVAVGIEEEVLERIFGG